MRLRPFSRFLAAGLLGLACSSPAWADEDDAKPRGTWRQVFDPAPVTGLDGKPHAASCSGYPGTDSRFGFWHKRGASQNLVVYFEGGGACWDSFSCTFPMDPRLPREVPQLYMPQVPPGSSPAGLGGIFDATQPTNPVKDWSFVYIPYCTGDVHLGSAERSYFNVGHPVFPLPSVFEIQHRGFDNFMVVLDWMRRNVRKPDRILVAGASAGGYGASANFPWVRQVFPQARMSVLADAAQGVLSPAFDTALPGRNSWQPQFAERVFGNDPNAVPSDSVVRIAAAAQPDVRFGQFTTTFDAVQIQFYGVTLQTHPAPLACPTAGVATSWNTRALQTLGAAAQAPNYRHYLAAGDYHTILRGPQFYSEATAGLPFARWVAGLVSGKGDDKDDAPGSLDDWRNVACAGCLTPLPCP